MYTNNHRSTLTVGSLQFTPTRFFESKLSNQNDIVIGTPIAGRNASDIEGLIGFFVVPVQRVFEKIKIPGWQWKTVAAKFFGPLKERDFRAHSPERFLFSSAEGIGKYQVSETGAIVMITLVIIGVRLWLYFHNQYPF